MKKLFLVSLASFGLLLSGCGQASSENNVAANSGDNNIENNSVDLSSYPEGVRNGTVSVEFYDQLTEWNKKHKTMVDQTLTANRKLGNELSYEDYSNRMKEIEVEWKLYNEKISWNNITAADGNMYSTVKDIDYNLSLAVKYLGESAKSFDSVDKNLASEYSHDVDNSSSYLKNQMSEYNISN